MTAILSDEAVQRYCETVDTVRTEEHSDNVELLCTAVEALATERRGLLRKIVLLRAHVRRVDAERLAALSHRFLA